MANYRSVHVRFWSDPKVEKLTANARYLFLYLFTNPHRNEACLYSISLSKIVTETGITAPNIRAALTLLQEAKRVYYDNEEEFVWVVNAVKYQSINENCIKAIYNDLSACSSEKLYQAFTSYYVGYKGLDFDFVQKTTHTNRFVMGSKNPPIDIGIELELGREEKILKNSNKARPLNTEIVAAYMHELGIANADGEARKFWAHHETRGWVLRGNVPMKSWRAAVVTWKENIGKFGNDKKQPEEKATLSVQAADILAEREWRKKKDAVTTGN